MIAALLVVDLHTDSAAADSSGLNGLVPFYLMNVAGHTWPKFSLMVAVCDENNLQHVQPPLHHQQESISANTFNRKLEIITLFGLKSK